MLTFKNKKIWYSGGGGGGGGIWPVAGKMYTWLAKYTRVVVSYTLSSKKRQFHHSIFPEVAQIANLSHCYNVIYIGQNILLDSNVLLENNISVLFQLATQFLE